MNEAPQQYHDTAKFAAEHPVECYDKTEEGIFEEMEKYNQGIRKIALTRQKLLRDAERDKQANLAQILDKYKELAQAAVPSLDTFTKTVRDLRPLMIEHANYTKMAGEPPPALDPDTTRLVDMLQKLEPTASSGTVQSGEEAEAIKRENRRLKQLLFHQAVVFNKTCDDYKVGDVTHRGCKWNSCLNTIGRCHNSACKVHAYMKIAHPEKIKDDLVFDYTQISRWQAERNGAVQESELLEGYIVPVGPGGWKANAAKWA